MASIKKQREAAVASGASAQNSLLGASTSGRHARWLVSSDVPAALDAVTLCETVVTVVLNAHRTAITAGVRADDGSAQPTLDPEGISGRDAKAGKRPNLRGVTAKRAFPNKLVRSAVRIGGAKLASGRQGTRASATIQASVALRGWLAKERDRGVGYFTADGEIRALVEKTLLEWARVEVQPVRTGK